MRSTVLSGILLPLAPATPLKSRWVSGVSDALGTLAEARGKIYFGTAFTSWFAADRRYGNILEAKFNQYTPENEGKWEIIEPQRGVFNWTGFDLPEPCDDPDELKQVLREHIDAFMGRYAEQLHAIDVVKEPLYDNGAYKASVWYVVLGEDYIPIALNYSMAAAPNVKLCMIDYNIEAVNNKSEALLSISKGLLAQGAPLDGIGFESHFIGGQVPKTLAAA